MPRKEYLFLNCHLNTNNRGDWPNMTSHIAFNYNQQRIKTYHLRNKNEFKSFKNEDNIMSLVFGFFIIEKTQTLCIID